MLATPESVFLFAIGILGGNLHHSTQGHVTGSTKLQIQLSVLDAFLEGTNFLVIRHILHCMVQCDPSLDIISQGLIRLLHTGL